jgi:hypothetical protein
MLKSLSVILFGAMRFANQLYGNLAKLNLWLHACLALAGVVLLFAIPVFPRAGSFSNGFTYLYGAGMILIFGIGDGYPTPGMKILGWIILAILALAILCTLIVNFTFFFRLFLERTKSWHLKVCLFSGVISILALSFFMAWVSDCEEIASNAIIAGNIRLYERAARWRHKGDINDDLYCAARWGQLGMVEYLLSKGADPNAKLGSSGDSVLSGASQNVLNKSNGNTPVVQYLKSHGATN